MSTTECPMLNQLSQHAKISLQVTGRKVLAGLLAGFSFWYLVSGGLPGCGHSPAEFCSVPGKTTLNSCALLCRPSPGTGLVSLRMESELQISLGNVSLRQNSALGKPLRNCSLPSLEAGGQESIV